MSPQTRPSTQPTPRCGTGRTYHATGADDATVPFSSSLVADFTFNLQPDGPPIQPPDPVMPLNVTLVFTFNPDTGALLAVDIEAMSVLVP